MSPDGVDLGAARQLADLAVEVGLLDPGGLEDLELVLRELELARRLVASARG